MKRNIHTMLRGFNNRTWPLVFLIASMALAGEPRVAVWNPEQGTREFRFKLDLAQLAAAAATLQAQRLTTEQLDGLAAKCDVLVLPGDSVPKAGLAALQKFTDEGGVLVALAGRIPFLVAIEKGQDGGWTMAPKEPTFAWQTEALLGHLGLHYVYNVGMHDQGVRHTATPLLKKYLPDATEPGSRKLTSNFLVPNGGEIYPLIRSQRIDGADVTPQLYVVQNGKRRAIIATLDPYLKEPKTLAAVVRLAKDLRDGTLKLTPEMQVKLAQTPPEPLRTRLAMGSVEPDKAKPLVRWGNFDGTSFDLSQPLPPSLAPGASVTLPLPAHRAGPLFLRIRGAYVATGAGLCAKFGNTTLWNERFTYLDAGGLGNISVPDLSGVAAEFTRIVFLPPDDQATGLTLSNPGTQPVYFDAAQVEVRPQPTLAMVIGLNGMAAFGGKNVVPLELSRQWGSIRANIRTQTILAPGKPNRFKKAEEKLEMYLAAGAPVELLFEGTTDWDAISAERFKAGGGRSHVVPPDNAKYAEIVAYFVENYGDRIAAYELWNETNSRQFWLGTYEEYAEFFKTMAGEIRKRQPRATIITGGMAGQSEPFVIAMQESGALKLADRFAFHTYAGKSPAWDMTFGMHEGFCFSRGIDTEIYCNEAGFPWQNSEWFQPPPNFTLAVQARLLDIAMARLLANGLAKLSVFHAGGDKHPYGLIDENGQPRPAYAVMADYFSLSRDQGRRLNVSLTGADGQPLSGIYAAASTHADGSVTVVLNPAEIERFHPRPPPGDPSHTFTKLDGWAWFFGKAVASNGVAVVTPGTDKTYAGFYTSFDVDLDQFPLLEVSVPECAKTWSLTIKTPDKKETKLFTDQKAGTMRVDYRTLLGRSGEFGGELSFRVTGTTSIAHVKFLRPPDAPPWVVPPPPAPAALPVILRVPVSQPVTRVSGVPAKLTAHDGWVELGLGLTKRTVISLKP